MNLKSQNFFLTILCVILTLMVLGLLVWIWYGGQIELVDHQLKSIHH